MKLDDSNKNYSIIIAGILILSVTSIFVANLMGLGGHSIKSSRNLQLESAGLPFSAENSKSNIIEGNSQNGTNDVHVAQSCVIEDVPTEPGKLDIIATNYDNIPLPLCVTPETVDDWYVDVNVTGGYEFKEGKIKFYQKDEDGNLELIYNDCNPYMYLGYDLKWEFVTDLYKTEPYEMCECCWDVIRISVDPTTCNNWACIDSSETPVILYEGEECTECSITQFPVDLDKEVTIKLFTIWEGCPLEDQEFEIIYAHKNCVHRIPNSRIKI
jgi:hypothetical protein